MEPSVDASSREGVRAGGLPDLPSESGTSPVVDPPKFPDDGDDAVKALVSQRRDVLRKSHGAGMDLPAENEAIWGLALSGGGIRSATFCLGLLRALAKNGLLLRFDLLSTVSGGGYIGATLGRLFDRAKNPTDALRIQRELADGKVRWFLWWLRANGRYLIPAGAKDTAFAAALYLRNFLGVHFEIGLIAVALGLLLSGFNLIAWSAAYEWGIREPRAFFVDGGAARHLYTWFPAVWFLLIVPAFVGAVQIAAYWDIGWLSRSTQAGKFGLWFGGLAFTVAFWFASTQFFEGLEVPRSTVRQVIWWTAIALMTVWLAGVPLAEFKYRAKPPKQGEPPNDYARNLLTKALSRTFVAALAIFGAGIADRVAWYLAFERTELVSSGISLFIAAAVARAVLPAAAKLVPGGAGSGAVIWGGRAIGYLFTFLLCAWWISLVHATVLGAVFTTDTLTFEFGWLAGLIVLVPVFGYLVITGFNVEFLNLSSLHNFYRARLSRSYLGAANAKRFEDNPQGELGALDSVPREQSTKSAKRAVGAVVEGDDAPMWEYMPHLCGGPVHLINICINESKDPRGGQFNQDRRGQVLTVTSGGLHRISLGKWIRLPEASTLSLASWTAISGAAFAPGLGAMTRGGISALATFAGIRTGYWWSAEARAGRTPKVKPSLKKSLGILRETFGTFSAADEDSWFLSDGGHFENTGAYALLSQRAEVIVLADCGADPTYRFEDVENLVRKARIDLRADVLFLRPRKAIDPTAPQPPSDLLKIFGSLNDLASTKGSACLALARVEYLEWSSKPAILVVVKPNICHGLPVDLVNFKAKHPEFPQQTTLDQFFSEAQWESYHQLGLLLGDHLTGAVLGQLLANRDAWFEKDDRSPFERIRKAEASAAVGSGAAAIGADAAASGNGVTDDKEDGRLPARIAVATTAVGATLSLGAAATLGVAAWQAIDTARASYSSQINAERNALKELAEKWAKTGRQAGTLSDTTVQNISSLAAAVLHSADTLCPVDEAGWFQRSALALSILNDARTACESLPSGVTSAACDRLQRAATPDAEPSIPWCLVAQQTATGNRESEPQYWGFSYSKNALSENMHPCDPVIQDRARALGVSPSSIRPVFSRLCERSPGGSPQATSGSITLPSTAPAPVPAATQAEAPSPQWLPSGSSSPSSATVLPPTPSQPARAPASTASGSPAAPSIGRPPVSPPAAPAATAQRSAVPLSDTVCKGKTIYIQIYGPDLQRDVTSELIARWKRPDITVPGIEDVVASAAANGRPRPRPVSVPTVRFHDDASARCANALRDSLPGAVSDNWKIEPLSTRFRGTPGVIEVWLPPDTPLK